MATGGKRTWILLISSIIFCIINSVNLIFTLYQCWSPAPPPIRIGGRFGPNSRLYFPPQLKVNSKRLQVKSSGLLAIQPYLSSSSCHLKTDALERRICEIEANSVFHWYKPRPMVIARDLSVYRYYAQRDLQGWTLAYNNFSFDLMEHAFKHTTKLSEVSVLLCLGIVSQDRFCMKPSAYKLMGQGQRINQVHGMRDILWRKDAFCYTLREALQGYKGWNNFTFPCWVLPQDNDVLKKDMMTRKEKDYIVKPAFRGEGHGIYVIRAFDEIQHSLSENYVAQPFLSRPLLVKGRKFDLRTYVLVTSISPLSAYFYKEGLVRFASGKYDHNATRGGKEQQYLTNTSVGKRFSPLANLTWTYARLVKHLERKNVNTSKLFNAVRNAITRTLLASEYRFLSDIKFNLGGYDCRNCFQLLGIDVIITADLHPIVIEVNGLPSMQLSHDMGTLPNINSAYTATKYGLLNDVLATVYGNVSVVSRVARLLRSLRVGIGPGALCDAPSYHIFCIDAKTLQFLVRIARESELSGGFQRLYPVSNGEKYSRFIKHMDSIINKKLYSVRTLWTIHHLLTAFERVY